MVAFNKYIQQFVLPLLFGRGKVLLIELLNIVSKFML
jgi:hypothetical protein